MRYDFQYGNYFFFFLIFVFSRDFVLCERIFLFFFFFILSKYYVLKNGYLRRHHYYEAIKLKFLNKTIYLFFYKIYSLLTYNLILSIKCKKFEYLKNCLEKKKKKQENDCIILKYNFICLLNIRAVNFKIELMEKYPRISFFFLLMRRRRSDTLKLPTQRKKGRRWVYNTIPQCTRCFCLKE